MDLNRAAIFVRVVAEGGFTAAARALHLPKSSVSRAVSLLEEELGARLLQRSTRKVHLTEAGNAFYERAAAGIGSVQEAAAAVTELQVGLHGSIRITAPLDAGTWMLAPLIARFITLHPGVYVDTVLTARVVDLVSEGFDFGLRVTSALRDSSLVARKLARIAAGLYASPAYLARKGTPTTVAALRAHQCVLFRPDRGRATWRLDSGTGGAEEIEVKGVAGADDFFFVQRMLLEGAGIGQLPTFLCDAAVSSGDLVRVLPEHGTLGGHFHLAYPSARHLPHRCAAFRDFVIEALGERGETIAAER
jgi:DNA-binding transcriptional LysR family regulator